MAIDEKEIISKMLNLLKFGFDQTKTSGSDLIAWANNILGLFRLILPHILQRIFLVKLA